MSQHGVVRLPWWFRGWGAPGDLIQVGPDGVARLISRPADYATGGPYVLGLSPSGEASWKLAGGGFTFGGFGTSFGTAFGES